MWEWRSSRRFLLQFFINITLDLEVTKEYDRSIDDYVNAIEKEAKGNLEMRNKIPKLFEECEMLKKKYNEVHEEYEKSIKANKEILEVSFNLMW